MFLFVCVFVLFGFFFGGVLSFCCFLLWVICLILFCFWVVVVLLLLLLLWGDFWGGVLVGDLQISFLRLIPGVTPFGF